MDQKETREKYSDEIDLYELILVLKRRIKYIIGVLIIGLAIGGAVAFLSPNIYQARATLWVDSVLMKSMLESLKSSQFKGDSRISFLIQASQGKLPDINSLSLSIFNSLEFKRKVLIKIKETYKNDEIINNLAQSLNSGKGEVLFKAEIDKKTGSINLISEQRDKKLAENILSSAIEEFEKELNKVSQSYSDVLISKGNSSQTKNFIITVIEKPNSLEKPVKPKKSLILAASAISSLFLGIFLAFVVEWWSNMKARKQQ